jgi:branched-chain amino acid aminotransferase
MQNKRNYIWLNGDFMRAEMPVIGAGNRAFAYGDGFFESIHAYGTEGKHLDLHLNRMLNSMRILEMIPPPFLTLHFLSNEIKRTLNKNRIFGSARVRITVYRNEGGLYAPTNDEIGMTIKTDALEQDFYPYNSKGLVVDLYTDTRKPINILSPIKSCNALLYVLSSKYVQQNNLDDCILINDQNRVAEATSSNLFALKGKNLITPPISEGCVSGVMRSVVIKLAPKLGLKLTDNQPIEPSDLLNMDELFLTNTVKGIEWIVGLRTKRYFGVISKRINYELNKLTFPDQFKDGFSG